jgi:hypothetical protein
MSLCNIGGVNSGSCPYEGHVPIGELNGISEEEKDFFREWGITHGKLIKFGMLEVSGFLGGCCGFGAWKCFQGRGINDDESWVQVGN